MDSFLEDIMDLAGCHISFQVEDYRRDFPLDTLGDPDAPFKDWEDVASEFLDYKASDLDTDCNINLYEAISSNDDWGMDFKGDLDIKFDTMVKLLRAHVEKLYNFDTSRLTLNSHGLLISGMSDLAEVLKSVHELRKNIAYIAVIDAHYKARKLRNIAEYVQKNIQKATAEHVQELIETVDEVDQTLLSISDERGVFRPYGEKTETLLHDSLYDTARRCAILPSRMHMNEVQTIPSEHRSGGGFADVYKATLSDGRVVALKIPRILDHEITKLHAEITKEALLWDFSKHKNILPLLGISCRKFVDGKPALLILVTPWMNNGTLRKFLQDKPDANRKKMIEGVISGVNYLHERRDPPVVHGDLRCDNILVDEDGIPKIADFGLSRVKDLRATLTGSSSIGGGSLRWQAPELIDPKTFGGTGKQTCASDIYAFGSTCLEIITGEVPYSGKTDLQVWAAVLGGSLPELPDDAVSQIGFNNSQRDIIKRCWNLKVEDRPSAMQLHDTLIPDWMYRRINAS